MELMISHEEDPRGWLILAVQGEIDLATAPDLEATLQRAITLGDHYVAIDLSPVSFMDSTGLRSLIMARQQLEEAAGRLVVIAAPGPARRLLEVAGVIDALGVVGSREELPSAGGGPPGPDA